MLQERREKRLKFENQPPRLSSRQEFLRQQNEERASQEHMRREKDEAVFSFFPLFLSIYFYLSNYL